MRRQRDTAVGEAEVLDVVDLETGGLDGRPGVTVGVAAPDEGRPHGGVEHALHSRQPRRVRPDMLEEPQLSAGAEYAADLRQRRRHIGHGAEHEGGDRGVEGGVAGGQAVGDPVDDLDRDRGAPGGGLRQLAEVGFGLDREDVGDPTRVAGEVEAVARADLYDPAREPAEELVAAYAPSRPLPCGGCSP